MSLSKEQRRVLSLMVRHDTAINTRSWRRAPFLGALLGTGHESVDYDTLHILLGQGYIKNSTDLIMRTRHGSAYIITKVGRVALKEAYDEM